MKNDVLREALAYSQCGLSVIPCRRDKRPHVRWEDFQHRRATEKELRDWWKQFPDAQLGIVTGKVSDLTVIDIDSVKGQEKVFSLLPDETLYPIVRTPRGGYHLYFRLSDTLHTQTGLFPGVDVRSEGGYVLAPPSDGYVWEEPLSVGLFPVPAVLAPHTHSLAGGTPHTMGRELYVQGRRDDDLFHTALSLLKGGSDLDFVKATILRLAAQCDPPFSEKEAHEKVESAWERFQRRERSLPDEIREYVLQTTGQFTMTEVCRELQIFERKDRIYVNKLLYDYCDHGLIRRDGFKNGAYRLVEQSGEAMDIGRDGDPEPLELSFPFDIEEMVEIYPGNIIILAGAPNTGKTAFLLDFAKRNMNAFEVQYFNSEMGVEELRLRLRKHEDLKVKDWKVRFFERSGRFDEVIDPDAINIIDYLELSDSFYRVAGYLRAIHDKLRRGIAVVGLQKDPSRRDAKGNLYSVDVGRGGSFSLEKPRLYLSMDHGRLKIVKAKNWRTAENPNGLSVGFKIVNGWKFIPQGGWMFVEE